MSHFQTLSTQTMIFSNVQVVINYYKHNMIYRLRVYNRSYKYIYIINNNDSFNKIFRFIVKVISMILFTFNLNLMLIISTKVNLVFIHTEILNLVCIYDFDIKLYE